PVPDDLHRFILPTGMNSPVPEPEEQNDPGAVAGIALGIGVAITVWIICLGTLLNSSGNTGVVISLVLPEIVPAILALVVHRKGKRRFAYGLFVAAGVFALIQTACAVAISRQ